MKKLILSFTMISLLGCTKKITIIDAIKGEICSKNDNSKLENVFINNDPFLFNTLVKDTIKSNNMGYFFIDGFQISSSYYKNRKYYYPSKEISYKFYIEKRGYKKITIDIKDFKESKNEKLDTINLGKIYLELEK